MSSGDEQLLDMIYSAALEPSGWQDVLVAIGRVVDCEATAITRLNIVTGTGTALAINNGKRSLSDYFAYYYSINPLQLVDDADDYVADWVPSLLLDEDWLERSLLETSEYYNDFLRPIEAEWGMFLRLGLNGHVVTTISVGRSYRAGRLERAEVAKIERFHPHLIRAFALSERFSAVHGLLDGLSAAIEESRSATIVIDTDGRVLHANGAAEHMLVSGTALCLREGRLTASDEASARELASALAGALTTDRHQRSAASFRIAVPGRAAPLSGAVMPLARGRSGIFGHGVGAIVNIIDPIGDARTTGVRMMARFGFTKAEKRLAMGLLDGLDLRGVAARQDVTLNTVRTQLAAIFAKTGTRRQIDLVRLLASSDAGGPEF